MLSSEQLIEARHKLAAGRIIAIRMLPYFETTLMAMVTIEMPGFGKFTVDKRWRLYYDPELCLTWTTQEIAAEWIHNVEHIVRKHEERFASLEGTNHDHQKYNAAADGAINSDLKEQKIIMPNPEQQFYAEPNSQFPTWKKNMSAEEMYFSAGGGGGSSNGDPAESIKKGEKSEEENDSEGSSEDSQKGETNETSEVKDENSDSSDDTPDSSSKDTGSPAKDSDDTKEDGNPSKEEKDSSDPSKGESGDDTQPSEDTSQDSNEDSSENSDSGANDEDNSEDSESGDGEGGSETNSSGNPEEDGEEEDEEEGDIRLSDEGSAENVQQIGPNGELSDENNDGNASEGNGDDPSAPSDNDSLGDANTKPLPDCGSAAGGQKRDYESNDEDDGSVDDLSADTLLKKTAEAIQSYADSNPGKVPGGLLREAKNILEPQVDWVDEFLSMFRAITAKHSGYSNYSYSRPSRRSSGSAFILPVMRNPPAPELAIVLDTSGSMDEGKEIAMALAEMEEILNRVSRFSETQSIKIINCDAESNEVVIVRDLSEFEVVGGGGTDMRVGIKTASEIKPRMDIIMTITDGFTPWPKDPPADNPYATYIVLLVGDHSKRRANPPDWMTSIEVKIPQKRSGLKM